MSIIRECTYPMCSCEIHCDTPEDEAKKLLENDDLPRCDCGYLFEICMYPICPYGTE